MAKVIKCISEEEIEIVEYRKPNICFNDDKYTGELYCTLRKRINPFQLYYENQQIKEKINQYENPDDMTLFYMWLDTKAKDKMKHLENQVLKLKQENQIVSDLSLKNMEEINDKLNEVVKSRNNLQARWNSLREWLEEQKLDRRYDNDVERFTAYGATLDKINELEGEDK